MKITGIPSHKFKDIVALIAIAKVKLAPAKNGVGLAGYVSINPYSPWKCASITGASIKSWEPCPHFWLAVFKELRNLGYNWNLCVHNHYFTGANTDSYVLNTITKSLAKKGLTCAGKHPGYATSKQDTHPIAEHPIAEVEPIISPVKKHTGTLMEIPPCDGPPMDKGEAGGSTYVNAVKHNQRPIHLSTCNLYVLHELAIAVGSIPSSVGTGCPDHLLSRAYDAVSFRTSVTTFYDAYAARFARNLFDFLVIACFGEARYGQGKSKKYTLDTPGMIDTSRSNAYALVTQYDPRTVLPVLAHCFNDYHWGHNPSVGGPAWGNIAKAAQWYFNSPPIVFADHCVDLAHNGGLAFNKGYCISNPPNQSAFMAMLDKKRNGSLLDGKGNIRLVISQDVYELLRIAARMGLVTMPRENLTIDKEPHVPTVDWGTKTLTVYKGIHAVAKGADNDDDSDGDTDDSDSDNSSDNDDSNPAHAPEIILGRRAA